MSHRVEKFASTLRQAIQQVIARGLHDPRISGLVTVTEVLVTPDLKNATVKISVLPEEKQQTTYYGLRDAARHIRHEVGDLVAMRSVPQLSFKLDKGLKKEAEALAAISKVSEELKTKTGGAPEAEDGAEPGGPDQPEPSGEPDGGEGRRRPAQEGM